VVQWSRSGGFGGGDDPATLTLPAPPRIPAALPCAAPSSCNDARHLTRRVG
jgi:hypothetical protein